LLKVKGYYLIEDRKAWESESTPTENSTFKALFDTASTA
jgi:hypothetical protein